MSARGPSGSREVLFEITVRGAYAKVTALDAQTGIEVSLTAPAKAGEAAMKAAALRKLDYVMKKTPPS